jgi:hypothetical protein
MTLEDSYSILSQDFELQLNENFNTFDVFLSYNQILEPFSADNIESLMNSDVSILIKCFTCLVEMLQKMILNLFHCVFRIIYY